jgi:hypothetical protein
MSKEEITAKVKALANQTFRTTEDLTRRFVLNPANFVVYVGSVEHKAIMYMNYGPGSYSTGFGDNERFCGYPVIVVRKDNYFHVAPTP